MITLLTTALAMLAFAANSLLCRAALGEGLVDAATFTTVRVAAGAIVLAPLAVRRRGDAIRHRVDGRAVVALFAYMICFSVAYRSLAAGTGALILFGSVQLTMFAVALRRGETFASTAWLGLALALGGLVYLVSPGVRAPDAFGALLMAAAGVAWGAYSLLGRGAADPLRATAANFLWAVPLAAVANVLMLAEWHVTGSGLALAAASGAIASGLGYVVWYAALRGLSRTRAATVQLSVPVLAALGGVALLGETLTSRLATASVVTLGGVALVLARRR